MEAFVRWIVVVVLLLHAVSAVRAQEPPPEPAASDEPPPAPLTRTGAEQDADSGAFDTVEEQVHQHVRQARTYFSAGQFDAAMGELQSAYALKPNPNYLFSIAQCHRRMGRNREALAVYQRFLAASPDTALRVETTNYIAELTVFIRQQEVIEKERRRPLRKKPWFWGVVGSSVAAAALGLGLGLGLQDNTPRLGFRFDVGSMTGALNRAVAPR